MVPALGTPKLTPILGSLGWLVCHFVMLARFVLGCQHWHAGMHHWRAWPRNPLILLDYFITGTTGTTGNQLSTSHAHIMNKLLCVLVRLFALA